MNQWTKKVGNAAKEEVVPFQHLEAGKNSKHHPISSQPKPKGHAAIPWCLYTSNTVSRLLLCQIFYVWIARSSCFWDPLFDGTTQRRWRGRQGSRTHSHAFGLYSHTTSQSETQAPAPLAVTCPWFSYDAWACPRRCRSHHAPPDCVWPMLLGESVILWLWEKQGNSSRTSCLPETSGNFLLAQESLQKSSPGEHVAHYLSP